MPDVSTFPRAAWLRALREALATMPDADLQYGDPAGVDALRAALADYLGRVRGVVADPARVVVTTGYTQSLALACHALAAGGAKRIALEDPTNPEQHEIARRAGLEPVPIPVDGDGLSVDALARARADAVVVTPAHQHPTGAVLSGARRTALLGWLREHDAVAIEDDYDAEYRYDRAAVGALQGLEPDRVAYAGSTSKTLAPALRLGWLVVPPRLLARIRAEKLIADLGTARIEQQAFAHFLERGELDRHLRRMRGHYRARRDVLVSGARRVAPRGDGPRRRRGPARDGRAARRRAGDRGGGRAPADRAQHHARLPRRRAGRPGRADARLRAAGRGRDPRPASASSPRRCAPPRSRLAAWTSSRCTTSTGTSTRSTPCSPTRAPRAPTRCWSAATPCRARSRAPRSPASTRCASPCTGSAATASARWPRPSARPSRRPTTWPR